MAGKKKKANTSQASNTTASSTTVGDKSTNTQLRGGASIQSTTSLRLNRSNIVSEFNRYFGNANNLRNWQRLCRDVGIEENLASITKCKHALKGVWVNIYDLIEAVNNDEIPQWFSNRAELSVYTTENRKIFPKKKAKEGGPVRALLAHIF